MKGPGAGKIAANLWITGELALQRINSGVPSSSNTTGHPACSAMPISLMSKAVTTTEETEPFAPPKFPSDPSADYASL